MTLLDTYISEIGRRLPSKEQADIEAEIRSTLEDMLADRSRKAGRPVDDEMTREILQEYGSPEKVAETYLPERYLVGPRIYANFLLVLRIVLAVLGVLSLVGMGIRLSQPDQTLNSVWTILWQSVGSYISSAISSAAYVVLVFAIIEWVMRTEKSDREEKESLRKESWDPRSLEKILPPDRIKPVDQIVDIVLAVVALAVFNFNPQIIGFTPSLNSVVETGRWSGATFIPILSEAFFRYLPLLDLLWALSIILNIVLLLRGYWNAATRWISLGMRLLSVVIAVLMLTGPSLIISSTAVAASSGDSVLASFLVPLLSQIIRFVLVLVIVLEGLEIVKSTYRLITHRPFPISFPEKS